MSDFITIEQIDTATAYIRERISVQLERHRVRLHWVEGHAGHKENEEVDELARLAASRPGLPEDVGFEG